MRQRAHGFFRTRNIRVFCWASLSVVGGLPGGSARRPPRLGFVVGKGALRSLRSKPFPARASHLPACRGSERFRGRRLEVLTLSGTHFRCLLASRLHRGLSQAGGGGCMATCGIRASALSSSATSAQLGVRRPTIQSSGRRPVASELIETPVAGAAYFKRWATYGGLCSYGN